MSNTNPRAAHIYNPEDGGTDMEIVISPDTWWHAVCNDEIKLTNKDYKELDDSEVDLCWACVKKAKESDPFGIIYNL